MHHPLLLLLLTAAGIHAGRLWHADRRAARAGQPHPAAMPGATDAPRAAVAIAVAGAMLILALETAGEYALDLTAQQSRMTVLMAVFSIVSAPIIEELIFRGWLLPLRHRTSLQWLAAFGASLLFALGHPF